MAKKQANPTRMVFFLQVRLFVGLSVHWKLAFQEAGPFADPWLPTPSQA
jgi:hypothetical protein